MCIYLYVKTHRITNLKYLGKTAANDPHKYPGSGVYWTNHLKKHGHDYTTEILRECYTKEEVKDWGLYYSKLWNIVESKEWANLKEECGDGGHMGRTWTPDELNIFREKQRGKSKSSKGKKRRPLNNQHRINLKEARSKQIMKPRSAESKARTSLANKGKLKGRTAPNKGKIAGPQAIVMCPHCDKAGGERLMKRWHFNNCKHKD